ncbi:MAG: helix-turn-helix domain-containing protein [Oscillospiraceae bacterium]|nr:helix-turn-helix domain-containing protein [Oscillospiraceae bacterium]
MKKEFTPFAQRLRELRKEAHMTQVQMAQALGLERSTYAYYEIGTTTPAYFILGRIAAIFRVSLEYLIGTQEDKQYMRLAEPPALMRVPGAEGLAGLTPEEQSFMVMFRQFDAGQRAALLAYSLRLVQALGEKKQIAPEEQDDLSARKP